VEQLFSKASGKDLKPYFDFYMRTIEVLDFQVKETAYQTYQVKATNYFHDLPLEITTGNKTERMTLTKDGITIKSATPPLVDPGGYYMKKITY
jgi:hypothetical protein